MKAGGNSGNAGRRGGMRAVLGVAAVAVLASCASVPRSPPRIERLPDAGSAQSAPAKIGPYSMDDVVTMARAGDPAPVIVQKLRDSGTPHGGLAQEQASALARQGVPADVVLWLRFGDRAPGFVPRSAYRDACLRNPHCRSPAYFSGFPHHFGPAYPYPPGFGFPPYRSGLSFGYRFRP